MGSVIFWCLENYYWRSPQRGLFTSPGTLKTLARLPPGFPSDLGPLCHVMLFPQHMQHTNTHRGLKRDSQAAQSGSLEGAGLALQQGDPAGAWALPRGAASAELGSSCEEGKSLLPSRKKAFAERLLGAEP